MGYLRRLRRGILNGTQRGRGDSQGREHKFSEAFDSAYTFFFTATLGGLYFAPEVLGLPLAPFLRRAADPACNAFFLNAVVLGVGSARGKPPWQDFAVNFHADQSLRAYAHDVPLPGDGTARTVVILYLNDVAVGGELEVYEHYPAAEPAYRTAARRARRGCRHRSGQEGLSCQRSEAERALANVTLGRVKPRTGLLVHFAGSRSHAVRRVPETGDLARDRELRVSLVLEQFVYPPEALARIPAVWAEAGGKPFFADKRWQEVFADRSGRPQFFGRLPPEFEAFHGGAGSGGGSTTAGQ